MQLADLKFKDGSKFTSLLDLVFPIGSTYMSMGSASPDTLFGGTWSKVTGGVLALAGTSGYAAAGAAGGSKKISVSQMPSHAHLYIDTGKFCWNVSGVASAPAWGEAGGDTGVLTGKAGGGRTIIRSTSRSIYGGAPRSLFGGAQWLKSCFGKVPASVRTAHSLLERAFSVHTTRTMCGPERSGISMARGTILCLPETRTSRGTCTAATSISSQSTRCRVITIGFLLSKTAEALRRGGGNGILRRRLRAGGRTEESRLPAEALRTITCRSQSPCTCTREPNRRPRISGEAVIV